jgi:dipeptidyl aminopeptidase/acylaminoacyl peptidase
MTGIAAADRGGDGRQLHLQNSMQFLWAMQQAGKDCDFMVYPRVRHGIEGLAQQIHLFSRFLRFLQEKL